MNNKVYIDGFIGDDFTYEDAKNALDKSDGVLEVIIGASDGGYAEEGYRIAKLFKDSPKKVIVKIYEHAYSAASIIFASGDERYIYKNRKPLMMHNPYISELYNVDGNTLYYYAQRTKDIERKYKQFYEENMNLENLDEYIKNEVIISSDILVKEGFANYLELKAVAKIKIDKKLNSMNKTKSKVATFFQKVKALLSEGIEVMETVVSDGEKDIIFYTEGDMEDGKVAYLDMALSMPILDFEGTTSEGFTKVKTDSEGVISLEVEEIESELEGEEEAEVEVDTDAKYVEKLNRKIDEVVAKLTSDFNAKIDELTQKHTLEISALVEKNKEMNTTLAEFKNDVSQKQKRILNLVTSVEKDFNGGLDIEPTVEEKTGSLFDNSMDRLRKKLKK